MAYLAVNKDGTEKRFHLRTKPYRLGNRWVQWVGAVVWLDGGTTLIPGTISSLTGKKITWNDEPIKI